ncbi:Uncharacterised protein [Yersinia mollaretii]|nr:Uncharacterised protein [Yersinia mollaretii]
MDNRMSDHYLTGMQRGDWRTDGLWQDRADIGSRRSHWRKNKIAGWHIIRGESISPLSGIIVCANQFDLGGHPANSGFYCMGLHQTMCISK